uniref:Uncharacterized protein LOC108839659 n=1 Tax=Raphanus sativus TaxID=3726 RepID=A0A6J0M6C1_RAPSA|nr:uncharacterized protein LOC108839659 [Raphanus sativus]KAJ4911655.1 Uncharacterized protein Rs2_06276 [Raphanus sativus]
MDVSGGFSSIPRSDLKIGGNELDEKDNERQSLGTSDNKTQLLCSSIKTDVDCDKGASVSSCLNDDLSSSVSSSSRRGDKPGSSSECGSSSVVPVEGNNDPMKLWKAMKQNGFLSNPHGGGVSVSSSCVVSSSHGGIPAPPRKRGRRSKSSIDAAAVAAKKRKVEIARKEEADRFARLAAPSGLLNELNPGIINHVRNKRQVLSIIQSIVKSDKDSSMRRSDGTVGGSRKNLEDVNTDASRYDMPEDNYHEERCEFSEDNNAAGKYSENASSLSNEDAASLNHASVLTVKAATVASQWLELLHQDIKCRVSALRRSKKRVRAVVTTELPFLISKEFPADQENDPNGASRSSTVDNHKNRWMSLFNQLEQTLSEEEKQLENWLNQVRELQSHCDRGLHNLSLSSGQNFLQLGMPSHSRAADALLSDKDFVVRAAAASIYSTCNFLASKENIAFT